MRRLAGAVIAVIGMSVTAAFMVATSGAVIQSPIGDTCTASGSGSTYTLLIGTGSGPQQYGFAFGTGGATIANAVIPGNNGDFTTENLAPNTTGAWVSDTPLSGSFVVSLSLRGTPTGSFTVVPSGASQSPYFARVTCTLSSGTSPKAHAALSVNTHVTYDAAVGGWHIVVTVPTGGTVSAAQPEPTISSASAKAVTAKPTIESNSVALKSAGKATLTLRPTGIGKTELKAKGAIKLQLRVTFDANNGTSGSKLLSLTLQK